MRICKRISYLFLVSIILMSLLVGCESSSSSDTQEKAENTTEESSNNDSSNSEFEEYNVLSFSDLKLDKNPRYDGDDYYYLKVKVTNNSNKTVRVITPSFFVYDKKGDMIVSADGQEMGSLESNKSLNIETTVSKDTNMDNVKINNYSYNIGKKYYRVDLVSKYAEEYEEFTD